jgi:hypothetical protein
MAKIAIVCLRHSTPEKLLAFRNKMSAFIRALEPTNLPSCKNLFKDDHAGLVLGVLNSSNEKAVRDCSAYAGWLSTHSPDWPKPKAAIPDGTFALFRSDARTVELCADFCGTQTIWYLQTPELFIASTSQRAIPWFTGKFIPNTPSALWMLSSGCVGPRQSWDARTKVVVPNGYVRLDRDSWQLSEHCPAVTIKESRVSDIQHRSDLRSALDTVFKKISFDNDQWVLPLSGGLDSRMILLWLENRKNLRTVTWGTSEAPQIPESDASIAQQVAKHLNVHNEYLPIEPGEIAAEEIMQRFLQAGEGRVDHISGYLDGFNLWNQLVRNQIKGIIRGDECFGIRSAKRLEGSRHVNRLYLWADYPPKPSLADFQLTHLGEQVLPEFLQRRRKESNENWRDRLYVEFRIPTVLAALNDLKSAYVDVANPLLVRPIVEQVRVLPAHLRSRKILARKLVQERDIGIPYATRVAIATSRRALNTQEMRRFLRTSIQSDQAQEIYSPVFCNTLLKNITKAGDDLIFFRNLRSKVAATMPKAIKNYLKSYRQLRLASSHKLALRVTITTLMHEKLRQDAAAHSADS